MSIVGTRPPLISETNLYEPRHKARLAIKPGITGMWQVSGRSDITDFEEVVRLDKEYMEALSYVFLVSAIIQKKTNCLAEIWMNWSRSLASVCGKIPHIVYGKPIFMRKQIIFRTG